MKINQTVMAILVVVVLLGTVGAASAAGLWQTSSQKQPGSVVDPSGETKTDPQDIKGSYTFGEISSMYDVPLADLGEAFRIPFGTIVSSFQCKSLETLGLSGDGTLEVGVQSVRWFVALYTGAPFTPSEAVGLPSEAVAILLEKATLDDATKALLAASTVVGS
jgi:hypothetical protein